MIYEPVNNRKLNTGRRGLASRPKRIITKVILLMLSLTMFVDFANGMFSGLHLGVLFRGALLLLCSAYLIGVKKKERCVFVIIIYFLLANVLCSSLNVLAGLANNIEMAMKFCVFFAVYLTLVSMFKQKAIGIKDIEKVLLLQVIYAPALFVFSYVFGLGQSSYSFSGQSLGFKGSFLSLNSINIALMVLYLFCVDRMFRTSKIKWIFLSIYTAFPLAVLGTKTGLAIIVIIPLLYCIVCLKRKKTWELILLGIVAMALLAKPFATYIFPMLKGVIERQKWLFNHRSFWTYLTSTRNVRVKGVLNYYIKNTSLFSWIFGNGYYWVHHIAAEMETSGSAVIPLEMDWADIFVTYGVLGLVFTYSFVLKRLFRQRRQAGISQKGTCFFWASVILLLYGTVAGHLFFEAISSTFYGIVLAGLYTCQNKKRLINHRRKVGVVYG